MTPGDTAVKLNRTLFVLSLFLMLCSCGVATAGSSAKIGEGELTVTIDQAAGQPDPTNTSPINFTVVFSAEVTDFETGDVTLNGTAGATTAGNPESPKKQQNYAILTSDGSLADAKGLANGDLVCLIGTMRTTPEGERYIQVDLMTPYASLLPGPVGPNQHGLRRAILDGIHVRAWGTVKSGSVTSSTFRIVDGADEAGIKVVTQGAPGDVAGQFVSVAGRAAGFDGERAAHAREAPLWP